MRGREGSLDGCTWVHESHSLARGIEGTRCKKPWSPVRRPSISAMKMVVQDDSGFRLALATDLCSSSRRFLSICERTFSTAACAKIGFPECHTEPTRNEIRSRSFSRIQL